MERSLSRSSLLVALALEKIKNDQKLFDNQLENVLNNNFNDKTYDDHQLCIFCKYQQLSEVFLQCYFLLLNKMKMSIQFY